MLTSMLFETKLYLEGYYNLCYLIHFITKISVTTCDIYIGSGYQILRNYRLIPFNQNHVKVALAIPRIC